MKKAIVWLLVVLAVASLAVTAFKLYVAYTVTDEAISMGNRVMDELVPPDAGTETVTCCDRDGNMIRHPTGR